MQSNLLESAIKEKAALDAIANKTEDEQRRLMYWDGYIDGFWENRRRLDESNIAIKAIELTTALLEDVRDYAKNMDLVIRELKKEMDAGASCDDDKGI